MEYIAHFLGIAIKRGIELSIGEKGLAMTSIFDIKFWGTLKKKLKEGKRWLIR